MKYYWLALSLVAAPFMVLGSVAGATTDTLIYDNGPCVNRPGEGPGGSDGSVLVYPMGDNGWPASQNFCRVADDFTIPSGQTWGISKVRFFLYQPLSATDATFPGMTLQIWNGQPGQTGSRVVWGDTGQNVLIQSGFTGAYRYNDGSPNASDPIMWFDASVNCTLSGGTYWLDWAASISDSALTDIYQLPLTINGQRTTGNALWLPGAGLWEPVLDIGFDGQSTPQGFPFQIYAAPEPSVGVMGSVGAGLGLLVRIRSRRASTQ